jgi:hypothetical protein
VKESITCEFPRFSCYNRSREDDMQSSFKSSVGCVEVGVLHYKFINFMQDSFVGETSDCYNTITFVAPNLFS